jgi:hypothetical protein
MGAVGRGLADAMVWLVGRGPAVGLPLLVGVAGLGLAGWMPRERALRIGALLLGLTLLLPILLHTLTPAPSVGGVVGRRLGGVLVGAFGGFGSMLVTLAALVVLSVATVGWNPLRPLARWAAVGGGAAARGAVQAGGTLAQKSGEVLRDYRERREHPVPAPPAAAPGVADDEDGESGPDEEGTLPVPGATTPQAALSPTPSAPRGRPGRARSTAAENGDLFADPLPLEDRTGQALPPLDLLTAPTGRDRQGMERELDALGEVLVEKLRTFSVESTLGAGPRGPW